MAESKSKKPASKDKTVKVFDVAHPSKNVAPATSRPVIVGHTNSIKKDPMVSAVDQPAEQDEVPAEKVEIAAKPKREKTLLPISEEQAEEKEEPIIESFEIPSEVSQSEVEEVAEEAKIDEPEEIETPDSESEEDTSSEEVDTDETIKEPTDSSGAAVEAIVAGVNTKKDRKDQEEKEAKLAEEIQGMIASKKYYVKTHMPPGKRNLRWLMVLLILAILGGGGWYFGVGPGKELWSKDPVDQVATPIVLPTPQPQPKTEEKPAEIKLATFSNPAIAISFSYPENWKIDTLKDTEFPTRDVISLISPVETLKTTINNSTATEVEVYLRTRIFVENTTNISEYASDLIGLTSCSTEDVVVGNTPLKFIYLDNAQPAPNVSQVSVGPDNCVATGTTFNANDQIQLSTKKNTYIVYTEYVFSDEHLKKNGTTTPEAISTAQQTGILATKDEFQSGKNFIKFQELVKTFKEL